MSYRDIDADIVVKAEHISKRYRYDTFVEKSDSLLGVIANVVTKPLQNFRRIKRLTSFDNEDESDDVLWAVDDVSFDDGRFFVSGTDRGVDMVEVARAAYQPKLLGGNVEPGLDELAMFVPSALNFPNGCHIAEIEIDPETGRLELLKYVVVDDFGTILNPLLLEGQIHGGLAQGIGQALMEDVAFDPDSGQLIAGSFLDYGMPRADDLVSFEAAFHEVPTPTNPLGAKGAGEAGAVGALPTMMNAIVNALNPVGVEHVQMPATPERIWQAIQSAS